MFPHFVVIGDDNFDPEAPYVTRVSFTSPDMTSLFYDFDAFGFVVHAESLIETVLAERRALREVKTGEWPQVAYFTGKTEVISVPTSLGKICVTHRPTSNMGGPNGVCIQNAIFVSLAFGEPVPFKLAIDSISSVGRFLSTLAGRRQSMQDLEMEVEGADPRSQPYGVHWSYGKQESIPHEWQKPHPADVPLDAVNRSDEFIAVANRWIAREEGWSTARTRYLRCVADGNSYSVDRLVAAANMFDILPANAIPGPNVLSPELEEFQKRSLDELRKFAQSLDRDSAISAIARMGSPSLPKKVQHRGKIVEDEIGARFPNLQLPLKLAVACRNHFVHGPSSRFDFEKLEPFLSFLTDSLEFVFAASDLIECGWDAGAWAKEPHGTGHPFAAFRWGYKESIDELARVSASL